jgi:inorganic pyrophosphatase/exopolyphosphatase
MLPLGGMTTKGHGLFCGSLLKDTVVFKKDTCHEK